MSNSPPKRRPSKESARMSIRVPDKLVKAVRDLAEREHVDEATALGRLLVMGVTEYACQLYREGRVTLNEAAAIADATPREMFEVLGNRGIRGNITRLQQRKAFGNVTRALDEDNFAVFERRAKEIILTPARLRDLVKEAKQRLRNRGDRKDVE